MPGSSGTAEERIRAPEAWNETLGAGLGKGTYMLTVHLPDEPLPPLAILPGRVYTSHHVWLGDTLLTQSGDPDTSIQVADFPDAAGTATLRIEVENRHSARGGIQERVTLGTAEALARDTLFRICETVLFAGCAILLGIYHLLLWLNRRQEMAKLAFGVSCLVIAARILLLHEALLVELGLLEGRWALRMRLEYLTFYLGVLLYYWVLQLTFPQEVRRWLLQVTLPICATMALSVITLPTEGFTAGLWVVQLTAFVTIFPAAAFGFMATRAALACAPCCWAPPCSPCSGR